jgi:TrmH family RNA methyltransferase
MNCEIFKKISSAENAWIKLLKKLDSKKYRQEYGQFMTENLVIISAAMKDGYDFEALFISEEFAFKHEEQLLFLLGSTKSSNLFLIDPRLCKNYSGLDTPSGIAAIYKIQEKALDNNSVVYLNAINDPGNLGSIMRSALAFGFLNLVLDENCVDVYNPKVVNAAKDAIFKLNIYEDKTGDWLNKCGLPIYTSSSHVGTNLSEFKPDELFCLVLGSESHGVSPEIIKLSKQSIKIEMSDKIESLNVGTAAAIIFYEFKRKAINQD